MEVYSPHVLGCLFSGWGFLLMGEKVLVFT